MKINRKQGYMIAGGIAIAAIAIAAGVHVHYSGRWYPGSRIDQVDVSGMTYEESIDKIEDQVNSYELTIKGRNNGTMKISGKDIGLTLVGEDEIRKVYEKQHESSVLSSLFGREDDDADQLISYSKDKIADAVAKADMVTGKNGYKITEPKNATIVYSPEKKYGALKKEAEGNKLDQDKLVQAIAGSVEELDTEMDLTDSKAFPGVYQEPSLRENDDKLKEMQKTYNQYLLHWIQWKLGDGVTETLTPDTLKDCITVDTKNKTVKISQSKVEDWIEAFCLKYKTQGIARNFKTHDGRTIQVSGGDYGWRLDYDKIVNQVMAELKKAPDEKAAEAYMENPTNASAKALKTSLKPVYSHEGYRMDFDNLQNDWDTKNYSEVDLSAQQVFIYKDGKQVFSCKCITGKDEPDRITRTGVYDVKEKKLTKTLVGEDYEVPTKYWTRIMWTGTGYHYSSRNDWNRWSTTYYKTAGSHGCVNLTLSDAESVYNLTKIGDPVFIHY